ncbi:hypothetical protein V1506DRAFT_546958 [Lipomyces tetrasporus]
MTFLTRVALLAALCLHVLIQPSQGKSIPMSLRRRALPNQFNPDPASGFDDPTIQIADPAFATAIKQGVNWGDSS